MQGRYALFRTRGQELDDPPHGSARRSGGAGHARGDRADARPAGEAAARRAALGLRGQVGRGPGDRLRRRRARAHAEPQRPRHHRSLSRARSRWAGRSGARPAILDGEVVAFDENGRPDFGRLQARMHLASDPAVRRRMRDTPVAYVIFDLLYLDGRSLMGLSYDERRAALRGARAPRPRVAGRRPSSSATAPRCSRASRSLGLEGVVAKRRDSAYEPGRRVGVVAEGQERAPPGLRDRRLAAGRGRPVGAGRRAARRLLRRPGRAALRRARRYRLHRGRARARARSCSTRSPPANRRSRAASRPRRRVSCARSSWPRSSSASGPTPGRCGRRPTRACARTPTRATSCARSWTPRPRPRRSPATAGGRLADDAAEAIRRAATRAQARGRAGRGRARGPQAEPLQPRQGALPADRLHQGRRDRLLRAHRAGRAAAPARPAADPQALPERRRGALLLREAVPVAPSGLDPHRVDRGPQRGQDDRLLHRRRPAHAGVAGEPRRPRAAPVAVQGAPDRAARR